MESGEVTNRYAPCFYRDQSTGKLTRGTYDYAWLLAQQARMADEERLHPQIGKNKLTQQELQALAKQYDPADMTGAEYDQLLQTLLEKGVLGRSEMYGVQSNLVMIRPGHLLEGGLVAGGAGSLCWVGPLGGANGNAMDWIARLAQRRGVGFDPVRDKAFQKIAEILQQMNHYRLEHQEQWKKDAYVDRLMEVMEQARYHREQVERQRA